MSQPLLHVQSLGLQRGERRLFQNLDFSLERGGLAVVRGANGSGKTTLLRALAGLVQPAEGQVRVFGGAARRLPSPDRQRLLYLGHAEGLKHDLSVRENLVFWAGLDRGGVLQAEDIGRMLAKVDLASAGDRLVRHLSAGQRRRTILARMLHSPAELWLLDEPLTNLDEAGRILVRQGLQRHLLAGGAAVVATHAGLGIDAQGSVEIQL